MNRRAMVRIPLALAAVVLLSGREMFGFGFSGGGGRSTITKEPAREAEERLRLQEDERLRLEAEELLRLANAGDAEAQFQMYFRAADDRHLWLCRSASNGYNFAQIELLKTYLGEGILPRTPDYLHAYMWLRLIERPVPSTTKHGSEIDHEQIVRNYEMAIADWLTEDEMATAEILLRDWQPNPAACAARVVEQLSR